MPAGRCEPAPGWPEVRSSASATSTGSTCSSTWPASPPRPPPAASSPRTAWRWRGAPSRCWWAWPPTACCAARGGFAGWWRCWRCWGHRGGPAAGERQPPGRPGRCGRAQPGAALVAGAAGRRGRAAVGHRAGLLPGGAHGRAAARLRRVRGPAAGGLGLAGPWRRAAGPPFRPPAPRRPPPAHRGPWRCRMSAQRRHQLRDHLGRFTGPGTAGGGPGRGTGGKRSGTAGAGPGRGPGGPLRAVRRRLGRVPGLVLVAVVLLYQHGDSPAALAGAARAASAAPAARPALPPGAGTTGTSTTTSTTSPPAGPHGAAPPAAQPDRPTKPADVAAAWYAGRRHLGARQVRPLQQDKVSSREVRVLVLADRGNGRLDTALVTVRRDAKGRWAVP